MMKKPLISLTAFLVLLLTLLPLSSAEKIYYKNGKVVKGQIASRTKGTIWIGHGEGISTGISTKNISKIDNDDGSVSKYDYGRLEKMIQRCLSKAQYAEAAHLCGVFLEATPNYIRMHYLHGILNQKIGNLKEAAEDYDFLISTSTADSKIYNNRGVISAGNKEYDEAITSFIKAINKNPNMVEAHNNLANVFMQKNEYQRAMEEYKKVIVLEPANIKTLFNLGMAYNKIGDRENAKKNWEKILSINPSDKDAKKALESM